MVKAQGGGGCGNKVNPPPLKGRRFTRLDLKPDLGTLLAAWKAMHLPLMPLIMTYRATKFMIPRSVRGRCTMNPSCSAYAKQQVRSVGTAAAWPMIMAYMSLCICEGKSNPSFRPIGNGK